MNSAIRDETPAGSTPAPAAAGTGVLKVSGHPSTGMSLEMEFSCPRCGEDRDFWRVAAMTLHLGEKTKWRCNECDYGLTRINGDRADPVEA